jgi:hypothetical protein
MRSVSAISTRTKNYRLAFTLAQHFDSQYIFGTTNTKWNQLLKNPGKSPHVATNYPMSASYLWERWRKE